ncbi:2-oxoglutarate dehydrogenase E1 component [Parasulfuritortus cantonensis]|uniref:2-oxoglutarate dehydrogenase E1 component n=1 Tax=Parasulfuritortus cantonensis TaxID=2528202 RepID=A0A4R1B929_9PROT|nr:2-oxoglutarate dehydrogenase E1 component [Parasulfuritortus cantonensis]TCJ13029.1 2-oxoglutarate dehydrogenase E1 component [Parasulfuritortus cantonensis]
MILSTAYYGASAEYLAALADPEPVPAPMPAPPPAGLLAFPSPEYPLPSCDNRQVAVLQLINAWRFHGFRSADLDPIGHREAVAVPELCPSYHGLDDADLGAEFDTGSLAGPARDSLANIVARLRRAYGGTLGAEYMYLTDTVRKRWLQQRLETDADWQAPDGARRRWLLGQLTAAETLEKVIHTRYVGQKRFSLEGGESFIPLLNYLLELAAGAGVEEVGLGMAHRGRLNVMHNVLGRSALTFFDHEDSAVPEGALTGDVKYHQGYAREVATLAGPIRVALAFNPSHLEIVGPAVLGWVRAQQQKRADMDGGKVLPILVHGDAAMAGQGVVMESLNMSATRGFTTGGTIHVVINNQIGFTTSDPRDVRSSLYCTDVMKMIEAPVLHVNGDDPEAVLRAVRLAFDYRMAFHHDVAIDLVCYRRLGHNEQDEPMVTQPAMYRRIREHPPVRALYAAALRRARELRAGEEEAMVESCRTAFDAMPEAPERPYTPYIADWRPYRGNDWRAPAATAMALDRLQALGARLAEVPEGFELHPRVIMVLGNRRQMAEGRLAVDWGMAESLAYAGLLGEGHGVRLTGQDSGRGTFFHRHAVLHDQNRQRWDAGVYLPLQNLAPDQARFLVVDSLLSEEAVLAFEYGYASSSPAELVVWEAQFGDFANGAQVVIDQFVAAAEAKWGRLNGLVMFLPHGYEGQGPEHSSGRIERFLQLAAQDNFQVVQPSTAAQFFHLLRRQVLRPYRKPLVVFTPKSLLRHPDAASDLAELAEGAFRPVLGSAEAAEDPAVTRLVACSGRLYYDLAARRRERGLRQVGLIRIEQLYPFPDLELVAELDRYPNAEELVWAQDEPQNQGAWRYMAWRLRQAIDLPVRYAGRPESASPATGFASMHKAQLEAILETALGR